LSVRLSNRILSKAYHQKQPIQSLISKAHLEDETRTEGGKKKKERERERERKIERKRNRDTMGRERDRETYIRGVADELTKEYLLIAVKGVDDQTQ
jgi:hypothetical protein